VNKKEIGKEVIHFFGTTLGHTLGTFAFGAVVVWFKALKNESTIAELFEHPLELATPITITILSVFSIGLLLRLLRERRTIRCFGVRLFSKHSTKEEKDSDWNLLRQDINNASELNSELWILGASGKATFSAYNSPLSDVLQVYKGSIRIMLLMPESFGMKTRASDLKQSDQSYIDEILDSIDCCKDLLTKYGRDISLRLYTGMPNWKMIITNQHLWLQHYSPSSHVENTPVYGFEPVADELTLYSGQKNEFSNIWKYANVFKVDLANWTRRDYKQLLKIEN